MNLYGFAGGDPINFSDPFGLNPCMGGAAFVTAGAAALADGPLPIGDAVGVLCIGAAAAAATGVTLAIDWAGVKNKVIRGVSGIAAIAGLLSGDPTAAGMARTWERIQRARTEAEAKRKKQEDERKKKENEQNTGPGGPDGDPPPPAV